MGLGNKISAGEWRLGGCIGAKVGVVVAAIVSIGIISGKLAAVSIYDS